MLEQSVLNIDNRLSPIEQDKIRKQAVQDFVKNRVKKWAIYISIAGTVVGIIVGISRLL